MTMPTPPTGLSTNVFNTKIQIRWIKNPETNVVGYNIYNSTTSGGGISGYVRLNTSLIETPYEVKKETSSSTTTTEEIGGTRVTTITEQIIEVSIFQYEHENLTADTQQFYVVTAVNDLGEEGPTSIEVSGTPLVVPTDVYSLPLRTQNDVTLDYISTLLSREPKLDVKPGSVTRQLHIDPNSLEFSYAYVRIDFESKAQSLMTLRTLDDSDGDGISDIVSSSTYKQLLKEAYFFTEDIQVQDMIDNAFDRLAANAGIFRSPALKAFGEVTFYIETSPSTDIVVNNGEVVSTQPSETIDAVNFSTISSGTISIATLPNFYNPVTQRYELTLPIEAASAGSSGNVNSDTIINTNVSGIKVTNTLPTNSGRDEETNSELADRIQVAFLGLDVGTEYGYRKTVTAVPNVRDVMIVTAGNPLMQRDFDEVRLKHVFGKVDIYIRGGTSVQYQDTIGFLYNQIVDDELEILDNIEMIVRTNNPNVTSLKPIFSVTELRNLTKAESYDLLGNWTIYKNGILPINEMQKGIEVNVDLATGLITFTDPLTLGDAISATYDHKVQKIPDEPLANPATGGEVNFVLSSIPIAKRSAIIYKNSIALIETIDYTLNFTTGFLQLVVPLIPGDVLVASYKYIIHVVNEIVIASASGGEIEANLDYEDLVESILIGIDGISIELEKTNAINFAIGMAVTDILNATFRYRDSSPIVLLNQPVNSIVSVEGSISGALTEGLQYTFDDIDDILLEGNSIRAQRSIQIQYSGGIPGGDVLDATEDITLIDYEFTALSQKGIDTESIIVKIGATTYVKNVDYLIRSEASGINVSVSRTVTTSIPNGATVAIVYHYGELITIKYNVNPLIDEVQNKIEVVRHVTADVLVKGVLETKIDFSMSLVLISGADVTVTSSSVITAIANEINKLKLGEGIAQSDVIRVIEGVKNVKSVVVPLAKMVKANDTQINREVIYTSFSTYEASVVQSYTTDINALLQKTLGSNAGDGFYAIFENDRPLTLVANANDVDNAPGQGFISSSGEVIISTITSDLPDAHSYSVSYVVNGETGAKDINITSLEYLSVGNIIIATA